MRIRAQDVILSVSEPKDLSSQNILRARITEIQTGEGPSVAIALRTGSDRLLARITRRALAQMQLEVGQEVWGRPKGECGPAERNCALRKQWCGCVKSKRRFSALF